MNKDTTIVLNELATNDKEVLAKFKSSVVNYLKYLSNIGICFSMMDDIKAVKKCKTFKEVENILKEYDDGTFMYMVREGMI